MNEVVDRVVHLGALWGTSSDPLNAALGHAGDDEGLVLKHLESALSARTSADRARGELVRAAIRALRGRTHERREPLPAVARHLAVSERHLRALFAERHRPVTQTLRTHRTRP